MWTKVGRLIRTTENVADPDDVEAANVPGRGIYVDSPKDARPVQDYSWNGGTILTAAGRQVLSDAIALLRGNDLRECFPLQVVLAAMVQSGQAARQAPGASSASTDLTDPFRASPALMKQQHVAGASPGGGPAGASPLQPSASSAG